MADEEVRLPRRQLRDQRQLEPPVLEISSQVHERTARATIRFFEFQLTFVRGAMARWGRNTAIPPPRPIPWTMKRVESAETEMRLLPDGRLHLHIRHEVLRGVTPAMLVWWFQHLEGTIELQGRSWPRYHIWHPVDHIAIRYARRRPDGSVGPGAQ